MLKWFWIVIRTLRSAFRSRLSLALENLVLRQQLATLKIRRRRPRLTRSDRLFWVLLSKDAPRVRPVQAPQQGRVVERDRVGGLHHEYVRIAA